MVCQSTHFVKNNIIKIRYDKNQFMNYNLFSFFSEQYYKEKKSLQGRKSPKGARRSPCLKPFHSYFLSWTLFNRHCKLPCKYTSIHQDLYLLLNSDLTSIHSKYFPLIELYVFSIFKIRQNFLDLLVKSITSFTAATPFTNNV